MSTIININLQNLTPEAIKALQDRYGNVELEIRVNQSAGESIPISEEECWTLIGQLDWTYEDEDDNKVVAPLVNKLSQLPVAQIYQFADWLSEKLWRLDTVQHAQVFMREDDDYLSVDDFLYARCAVVANGAAVYYRILDNPAEMPAEVTFEPLLYVAREAFLKKTGEEMVYVPLFNYETYGNKEGWKN